LKTNKYLIANKLNFLAQTQIFDIQFGDKSIQQWKSVKNFGRLQIGNIFQIFQIFEAKQWFL
jgi:hypothetical protein